MLRCRTQVHRRSRRSWGQVTYVCLPGQTFLIDVVDLFCDETFAAIPATCYYFRHWKAGDRALCTRESKACHLSTAAFQGLTALESILMSEERFSHEPVFVWEFRKLENVIEVSATCDGVMVPDPGCVEVCPDGVIIRQLYPAQLMVSCRHTRPRLNSPWVTAAMQLIAVLVSWLANRADPANGRWQELCPPRGG